MKFPRAAEKIVLPMTILRGFFKMEASGGILLVLASVVALIVANSSLAPYYDDFLKTYATIRIGAFEIDKPLLLWINDGLMAVFFFFVGLEIKRELLEGALSTLSQAALPAIAAVGGIIVPAGLYALINYGDSDAIQGWAIPAATDIAFALGVLALLGDRVPISLKILLTAIAVLDDLGAISIIAIFYTDQLSLIALGAADIALIVLLVLNRANVMKLGPYIIVGIILWMFVLKSGVHATLAGVALAMTIPLRAKDPDAPSPLKQLEHNIHPWVAYAILPIFAFANAGVSFAGIGWGSFLEPVTLGIMTGLFIGKQIGIFGAAWLTVRGGLARMPDSTTWGQIYGMSLLCGIGFTMSLFIGGLAWEHAQFDAPVRLGVISGSVISALAGSLVLLVTARRDAPPC